jgi:hypothetical protein
VIDNSIILDRIRLNRKDAIRTMEEERYEKGHDSFIHS